MGAERVEAGEAGEDRDEGEERAPEPGAPGLAASVALSRLPDSDADARALLREQAHVLQLQAEHLHEQREVQLSHLKARRLSEWMKVWLQLLVFAAGVVIAVPLLSMTAGAARSRDVVVESFETPSALAARGITGKMVASAMLDALSRLQEATRATAAKRRFASAWRGDIKVEVPETGVSLGELRRLLHESLGQDVHVEGDLVQAASGDLSLTVRADGVQAKTFTGPAGDLEALTRQAAEYLYGQLDPYLLAAFLSNAGRTTETLAFLATAYPQSTPAERPDLLNQWGNALFDLDRPAEAAAKYRIALNLRPDFWKAWGNLVLALASAGREEEAWRVGREMAAAKARAGRPDIVPTSRDAFDMLAQDWSQDYADLTWDVRRHGLAGTSSTAPAADLAWVEAQRHDWAAAETQLSAADPDDPSTLVTRARIDAARAIEANDPAAAARALAPAVAKAEADPSIRAVYPTLGCELGLAEALAGQRAQGLSRLDPATPWTACRDARADALAAAGDRAGAAAAYRAAADMAPDLPAPHQRWGLAKLRAGDAAGALPLFAAAHARGPAWADPLKGEGDALAAQGRFREAVRAYDQALARAPNWSALKAARAAAAGATRR